MFKDWGEGWLGDRASLLNMLDYFSIFSSFKDDEAGNFPSLPKSTSKLLVNRISEGYKKTSSAELFLR
jgi:hypothetical protein